MEIIRRLFSRQALFHYLLLLLVASWPFANFLSQNIDKLFRVDELFLLYMTCCFALIGIVSLLHLLFRSFSRSLLLACVGFIIFFSYHEVCFFWGEHFETVINFLHTFHIKVTYVWTLLSGSLLFIVYRYASRPAFAAFLNTFLVMLPLLSWSPIILSLLSSEKEAPPKIESVGPLTLQKKPNIYFILVDGYPRADTIENVLKITPDLTIALKKAGFFVASRSTANYHFTLASVSSELMMSYHQPAIPYFKERLQFSRPVVGYNQLVDILKKNGYKFAYAPCGVLSEMSCHGAEDICLAPSINFDILQAFQAMTPLVHFNFVEHAYAEPDCLKNFVQHNKKAPLFVYAHFLQVHDMVTTTNKGKPLHKLKSCILCSDEMCDLYRNALSSFNEKLQHLILFIQAKDPTVLIVVQSDHGPCIKFDEDMTEEQRIQHWSKWETDLSPEDITLRLRNLLAVYIPQCCGDDKLYSQFFYDTLTPVNLWRIILSCLSQQSIPLLPDRNFIIEFDESKKSYYVKQEVTDLIRKNP